ncbi:hypothetical protein [Hydrogenophaga sp.]|uniref:hypothetical protein n=1 Tax=Hydrogenophaga sp. TaxID=1904254 RepID=UPI0025C4F9D8|nr:hypothetical protein [Hydrogenophaga sp.]
MTTLTPQPPEVDLQRRRLLSSAVVAAPLGLGTLGSAGCREGPGMNRRLSFKTLD